MTLETYIVLGCLLALGALFLLYLVRVYVPRQTVKRNKAAQEAWDDTV